MAKDYVESAQSQFESLKTDMTNKSVDTLTVVSSVSTGACIMSLFQSLEINLTTDGLISLIILVIIAWGAPKILNAISNHQKYEVSDIDVTKNIK